MSTPNYNASLLAMATAALNALDSSHAGAAHATEAQQSHFLCSWMAQALKDKSFDKAIAGELTLWVRQGRSMGASAKLKRLLQTIRHQYSTLAEHTSGLGSALAAMLDEARQQEVIVYTDTPIKTKLKLDADGQSSIIVCADEYQQHIQNGELIKPISLFVRADEKYLANLAFSHGLMLTQGDKKSSLIKHHKRYGLFPKNHLPSLALLTFH
ncbi:DUF2913 family protein [Shewanella sp. FJAT-52076]|uniref:DUF2913 family protein n=1 Tax=Shewanella sp. FJAT-52076 TaxID=2864202 RepID=UPI001C65AC32|nr:DUF2913 family protein [Shewanella sp. FJAT-52076]QYJ76175.1 DUF2913 family protein [Shewanella sp. FJAT-52076]